MAIGETIREYRKKRNLTQKQLGELSGTSESTIKQYELGKRQPRIEQLKKIAEALGVTEWHIMYGMTDEEVFAKRRENIKNYAQKWQEQELLKNYAELNKKGQQKAFEYVKDIKGNPDYRNEASADEPADPDETE